MVQWVVSRNIFAPFFFNSHSGSHFSFEEQHLMLYLFDLIDGKSTISIFLNQLDG